jgi:tyrosine-protein kinase Etk/Wzc
MEEQVGNSYRGKNWAFSPREFIFKYLKYAPWLIISLAVMMILAFLRLRYSTDIYAVQGSLLIKNDNSRGGSNEKFEDMFFFQSGTNLKNEIEILKSRPMVKRVVKKMGLQTQYINKGNIKSTLIYKNTPLHLDIVEMKDTAAGFSLSVVILDENRFSMNEGKITRNFGEIFDLGPNKIRILRTEHSFKYFASNEFIISHMPLESAAGSIAGGLNVAQVSDYANILNVSYETPNSEMGKDIVNLLMEEYDTWNIEDKNKMAFNILRFIDERVDSLKQELEGIEENLKDFRERREVIDLAGQSTVFFNNYEESEKEIMGVEVKIKIADFLLDYLNKKENINLIVPPNLVLEDPTLGALITQYNQLQLERERSLQTIPEGNPYMQNLRVSIDRLRQDIITNITNTRQTFLIARSSLLGKSEKAQSMIRSVPGKGKQLLDIERQQNIKQELYIFLLTKKEETAISAASTISNSRIVEPAIASSVPIKPNRRSIYVAALLIGLAIPIGFVILKEYMNDKITTRLDVERITDAQIIGEVGHSDEGTALVVTQGNRRFIAEQFRIIRTNLQYILNNVHKPVVLITSSFSGEGKSFISTNMGAVMALSGKRTVILEFDIRKPKILSGLEIRRRVGISNYLVGSATLEELVVPVPNVENLFVIPCGPVPPNPAEMLLDPKIKTLFEYVRNQFDMVIVDSAPVGLVSDAVVLSQNADCTLFIIRQRYTFKKQIGLIDELYSNKKMPRISLLINDIKATAGYGGYYGYGGYGYGYGYGYGGSNGSGYFDNGEPKKKSVWKRVKKIFN